MLVMFYSNLMDINKISMLKTKSNNKIRYYRALYSLTQTNLAELVGVTRQTILSIEKNKCVPSLTLAFKIAKVFNKAIEEVFTYEQEN
jgi:putative transcriptional regulator